MEYVGLFFEIVFFAIGLYLYLFARGKFKVKDPQARERMEAFRQKNSGWMRLVGLALMAVMLLNVAVHIQQLLLGS